MLHGTIHLAPVFLLLERLPLVKLPLTASQGNIHLGQTLIVYKHKRGHNGQSGLLYLLLKSLYLALLEQQLTVAACAVVGIRAIKIR